MIYPILYWTLGFASCFMLQKFKSEKKRFFPGGEIVHVLKLK